MTAGTDAGKEESGWIRDLHMLFVVIAEHEHAIEQARKQLCGQSHFNPIGLFKSINSSGDGKIKAKEIQELLSSDPDGQVLDPEGFDEVIKEIIREFDCDFDDELGYQEFLNIFLPSTDQDLRKKCMNNISGEEPTTQVRLLAADILSLESSLAFQKLFYRNNLSRYKYREFEPQGAFDKMCLYSEREGKVDMVAMKSFLETCKVPAGGTLAFMDDLRDSGEPLAFNRIDAGGPLSR